MKKILSVIAIVFVVFGFGMIHNPSVIMEKISIILMGIGIIYLIYILIDTRPKNEKKKNQN